MLIICDQDFLFFLFRDRHIYFLVVTPNSESESSVGNVEVMKLIEEKKVAQPMVL